MRRAKLDDANKLFGGQTNVDAIEARVFEWGQATRDAPTWIGPLWTRSNVASSTIKRTSVR